jgi:hypothetical protein
VLRWLRWLLLLWGLPLVLLLPPVCLPVLLKVRLQPKWRSLLLQ